MAVIFNSLLILIPVISSQVLDSAYSGAAFSDSPGIEAIDQTRSNIDSAFASLAPRNPQDRLRYWSDIVARELNDNDISAARGFLLAAPQMLDKAEVKELLAAAKEERVQRADDALLAAAVRKLPFDLSEKYRLAQISARIIDSSSVEGAVEEPETKEVASEAGPEEELAVGGPQVELASSRPEDDSRFLLLGTFADLADNSKRWLEGDRIDPIALKITAIGLIEAETADGRSQANIRAASILKSAQRSRRTTDDFKRYIAEHVEDALPDAKLRTALEGALSELVTTEIRTERVKAAYLASIEPRGLQRLEADLIQIDRIGTLTSPTAAVTLLEKVQDSADLRRARLIAEAGGDRAVALVKQSGAAALRVADTGIAWTFQMVLQVMGLTAAGLALFFVTWSTLRRNIRFPRKKAEPMGA